MQHEEGSAPLESQTGRRSLGDSDALWLDNKRMQAPFVVRVEERNARSAAAPVTTADLLAPWNQKIARCVTAAVSRS
jgi:hypothetical protein